MTNTRRMIEIYNAESLSKAVAKQIIEPDKNDKIEKYLKSKGQQDGNAGSEYEWTPCRFNPLGWKYQPQGMQSKYLNHPNKKNVVGVNSLT